MYWVLFPIEDLRATVDIAKRMLTKEMIDKQLAGQSSSTPFMSMRDSQGKKVSFNTQDDVEQEIDKLMLMMDKLVTEDERTDSKPFRPQIYQPGRGRNQNRGNFQVAGSEIMHTEDAHHIIKILEIDIGVILIIEEITGTMLEVVRDIGTIIMITGGTTIEVKIKIGIEVDH